MQRWIRVSLIAPLLLTSVVRAGTVYSNTTTDTLDTLAYAANSFTQIGDQIALAGTERYATLAQVQFFNLGAAGTFDATLRLFQVGAPVGSQIGSDFVLTGISAPANDVFNVTFLLPGILVPDSLIFTASAANPTAGVQIIGLDMFEPPTIGSSDNTFAIAYNGTSFTQVSVIPNENVYFRLDAVSTVVPEPSTSAGVVLALGAFALLRRRFRRS